MWNILVMMIDALMMVQWPRVGARQRMAENNGQTVRVSGAPGVQFCCRKFELIGTGETRRGCVEALMASLATARIQYVFLTSQACACHILF